MAMRILNRLLLAGASALVVFFGLNSGVRRLWRRDDFMTSFSDQAQMINAAPYIFAGLIFLLIALGRQDRPPNDE